MQTLNTHTHTHMHTNTNTHKNKMYCQILSILESDSDVEMKNEVHEMECRLYYNN